jgi:acetyl esterase/lipase
MVLLASVPALSAPTPPAGASALAPVTVSYGPSPFQTETVYPSAASGAPLVVLVHGGGWESKLGFAYQVTQATALQAAGFAVFDINYDPLSKATGAFPLQVDDVVAATQWAVTNATAYGADPTDVELLGGSAGGQLVALAAERMNAASTGAVRRVVTLSGALDLVTLMQDVAAKTVSGYIGLHLRQALACAVRAGSCTTALEAAWSPAGNVTPENCPSASLVVNDTHELMPVDQADSMTAALAGAGCDVTELLQPGRQHSFADWNSVQARVIAFLAAG